MNLLLLALLACADSTPPSAAPSPPDEARSLAVGSPGPEPDARPPGRIRGEPILPDAIVLGGIHAADVHEALAQHSEAIEACYQAALGDDPELSGKVLVRFSIARDGTVSKATTKSTSLRHPATEDCVVQQVTEARFPPLERGRVAIVEYPFTFPAEDADEG